MEAVGYTRHGRVRGTTRDGVTAFLGIPYAAPPFGPNRFQAPRPPEPWDGVRPATAYGPTAPKPGYAGPFRKLLPDPEIPGEECLNLNVWTPEMGGAGLPVMVWIHGGAFVNGSGAVPTYDGHNFARDGVVCVTINYRLGVEGFANLPGAPLNRGLLDQIAALEWVRDNIAGFGGDPDRVTVFGESAGAMSVTTLLSLDLGLFRRAITQSGAGNIAQDPDDALLVAKELAARLGVEPTAAGFAALDPAAILPVQAAVSGEVSALPDPGRWGATTAAGGMALTPILDGELLARRPEDAVAAGAGRDVALLTGYTAEEFRLFLMPTGVAAALTPDLVGAATAGMGVPPAVAAAYRDRYPELGAGELMATIVTDSLFRMPAHRTAAGHAANAEPAGVPGTWMYEFGWRSPNHDLGACHALELGFVFDNLEPDSELAGPNPPQDLADEVHHAWVRFAADGDPGWEPFDPRARAVRVFDGEANGTVRDPRGADRALWD
ncbi:carboxylesterase/lipase family protein [Actinomadura sp. WMMB 499]|uniref:carboxylesterase/lipase family protein n=1 Tax=Actinomadura sp. WMMB 499 TaxID=1219491 RepID=UPI001248A54B|nr:carboxylesterase/lipase family protein [Actinomadura sp. WMMB 499]QFG25077.1 carboxylesterase/lipase family protein [Actinomadura sp. WMMB 499]